MAENLSSEAKPETAKIESAMDISSNSIKESGGGKADRQKVTKHRPSPYPKGSAKKSSSGPPFNRVLVTNVPYEEKWQAIKDLFREKVGEVTYVELFTDASGRSRGYGIVEFRTKELCEEAVKKMNKYELLGRNIIVKDDYNGDLIDRVLRRDQDVVVHNNRSNHGQANRSAAGGGGGQMGPGVMAPMPPPMRRGQVDIPPGLPRLGGDRDHLLSGFGQGRNGAGGAGGPGVGPIGKTVFIANLDYKVTYNKLKEVFSLAGRVVNVDLLTDKDNKSRGMATVTYDIPMDAAQAISMLNGQLLYDRPMVVKMDKDNNNRDGFKLPAGLSGIGPTLASRQHPPPPPVNPADFPVPGAAGDLRGGVPPNPAAAAAVGLLGGGTLAGLQSTLTQAVTSHLSDSLQSNPLIAAAAADSRNPLGGLAGLAGLSDLTRLAGSINPSAIHRDAATSFDQQRYLEDRARLLAAAQGISAAVQGHHRRGPTEREQIDMDIARVDSRLRDINRSIVDHRRSRDGPLPPMPPPMSHHRSSGNGSGSSGGGGQRRTHQDNRGCTVFVRNLAYLITWQQLRERFGRCGNVMFADIKMDGQGKSRGFGYVRYEQPSQAMAAIRVFDNMEWEGRKLSVELKPENRD